MQGGPVLAKISLEWCIMAVHLFASGVFLFTSTFHQTVEGQKINQAEFVGNPLKAPFDSFGATENVPMTQ